jgi:hypothetical protein
MLCYHSHLSWKAEISGYTLKYLLPPRLFLLSLAKAYDLSYLETQNVVRPCERRAFNHWVATTIKQQGWQPISSTKRVGV